MEWLEIKIDTTPDGLDSLCARLVALGIDGLSIEEEADFLAFLEDNRRSWDYVDDELLKSMRGVCRVTFYLRPNDTDTLEAVRTALPGLHLTVNNRDEEEWADAWKQYYKPMNIGSRLFIRPEWEQSETPPGRALLVTNPGMAFGTGTHASTRLCLELIEETIHGGERVLDLGCGSGILSSAALLLGAESAVGVDIDPNAAAISEKNAALNKLTDKYSALSGDLLADSKLITRLSELGVNVVFSNIVADVIIALCPTYMKLAPGGILIASGVIDIREDDVKNAFLSSGIIIDKIKREDGWCAFCCRI